MISKGEKSRRWSPLNEKDTAQVSFHVFGLTEYKVVREQPQFDSEALNCV